MKLLLDENLSNRIVPQIADLFPDSSHVKDQGLHETDDQVIWAFAGSHGYALVSKDSDFHQRSLLFGAPPKFVYLKIGNCPTSRITILLQANAALIEAFILDPESSLLILS